ncbi:MAG TPA: sigma-70 family RNA polymerase sigma factor [Thermoanaerobaculia bacterium]|nr:sigma-70 family RNA polymerase sigma factor [Thermoanaerobaculia bacterium]
MTAIAAEPLDRARAGDGDGFTAIVSEHEAMVFSLAYHFFNDRPRAEEIAQDVFLQLFRNLGSIENPAHLKHWLRQVTTRRCIDQLRHARGLHAVPLETVDEIHSNDRAADPLLDRKLRNLIAGLPDMQRAVITLRYQEDLDPTEIAAIVGVPVNTVKSHLHRALQSLRRKLGEQ